MFSCVWPLNFVFSASIVAFRLFVSRSVFALSICCCSLIFSIFVLSRGSSVLMRLCVVYAILFIQILYCS